MFEIVNVNLKYENRIQHIECKMSKVQKVLLK